MAGIAKRFHHGAIKFTIVTPRFQQARVLANRFVRRVARGVDEGMVDRNDAVLCIRDENGFQAILEHLGCKTQLLLGTPAFRDIHESDDEAFNKTFVANRMGAIFDMESAAIPAPEYLVIHMHACIVPAGSISTALVRRIG